MPGFYFEAYALTMPQADSSMGTRRLESDELPMLPLSSTPSSPVCLLLLDFFPFDDLASYLFSSILLL